MIMKKENFDAIAQVANSFGIKVTDIPQECGWNDIECEYWTDTLLGTDNVWTIPYHNSEFELSEFCDELNEFWKDYDPQTEFFLFYENEKNREKWPVRQVIEEFELVDSVLEKFVNAMYDMRNKMA